MFRTIVMLTEFHIKCECISGNSGIAKYGECDQHHNHISMFCSISFNYKLILADQNINRLADQNIRYQNISISDPSSRASGLRCVVVIKAFPDMGAKCRAPLSIMSPLTLCYGARRLQYICHNTVNHVPMPSCTMLPCLPVQDFGQLFKRVLFTCLQPETAF